MQRYAIYFAPAPETPLWRFGSGVIGYDAETGGDWPFAVTAGLAPDTWRELTIDPRRYGFHATLKAPFALADGADEARLLDATKALAGRLSGVALEGLRIAAIGRFVALVPSAPSPALENLAARVVEDLDHFRAPLSEADRGRRLASPLTSRQIAYLDRYGYPYVRDEFRFHMTLTGPIADAEARLRIEAALRGAFAEAIAPGSVAIDQIAVYRQPARTERFRIIARYPLASSRVT